MPVSIAALSTEMKFEEDMLEDTRYDESAYKLYSLLEKQINSNL